MEGDQLYCKVYVDTNRNRQELLQLLGSVERHERAGTSLTFADLEVDVRRNEDFDPSRGNRKDEFVYYRHYLDIGPRRGVPREDYVSAVGRLLTHLSSNGCRVVAACDFESELPST